MEAIFILILILFIIGVQLYIQHVNEQDLNRQLKEHYTSDEMQVSEISSLSITEKLKYSVPIIPGMFMTTGLFSYFKTQNISYMLMFK
ncbi:hypothetical protein ACXR6G_05965 [Ancylomarina sp. YFZ004]